MTISIDLKKFNPLRLLTLVPPTALVVVSHDLINQELRKRLIVRDARQHLAELPHNRHELDRALFDKFIRGLWIVS